VLVAPVSVCVVASFVVTRFIPAPAGFGLRLLWLFAVVVLCGLPAFPARRQLRRLLPLATLLELSILFPGEAPTRWKVAREAGAIKHLEFLATGVPDAEPGRAATTILALVASLARHDRITRGHSERVRVFTDMISEEMGLPRADRDRLRWAALIHDIGKLEVPAKLLRKPGKPTASEWEVLRLHPATGAALAAPMADWLGAHAGVVLEHHERFDGTGYPAGLRGNQISVGGRIVALADAFETMTAARPYKKAITRVAALREVVSCSGTHFDPEAVRALLAVSTPRLRRALGPVSWISQLPVVGTAPVGGLPAVATTVARGTGVVMLTGFTGAVVASGIAAAANAAPLITSASTSPSVATHGAATVRDVPQPRPHVDAAGSASGLDGSVRNGRPTGGTPGVPLAQAAPVAPTASAAAPAGGSTPPQAGESPDAGVLAGALTGDVRSVTNGVTTGVGSTVTQVENGATTAVSGVVNGAANSVLGGVAAAIGPQHAGAHPADPHPADPTTAPNADPTEPPHADPKAAPTKAPGAAPSTLGGLLGGLLGKR
jgi:HD domain